MTSKRVLVVLKGGTPDAPRLTEELVRAGFRTAEAASVADAGRVVAESPDLGAAIIGTDLPVIYGWELVSRLRSDHRVRRIPIIVLGERDSPEDRRRADTYHCAYFPLPVRAADVVAELEILMKDAQRAEVRPVRVLLLTDVCEIEGTVHVPPEQQRFSDGWEAVIGDERSFVPVTDARLSSLDGERLIATTAFLQVPKAQLRAVLPVDERPPEARGEREGSAALIGKLTRVAAGLAKELADERQVPVREVLEEFVAEFEAEKEKESGPAIPTSQ